MEHKVDSFQYPLDQPVQVEEIATNWKTPDWAEGWLVEGYKEGRVLGRGQGRPQGRAEYRSELRRAIWEALRHRIRLSFDPETVEQLVRGLGSISDPLVLLKVSREMDTGATGADLLRYFKGRT